MEIGHCAAANLFGNKPKWTYILPASALRMHSVGGPLLVGMQCGMQLFEELTDETIYSVKLRQYSGAIKRERYHITREQ